MRLVLDSNILGPLCHPAKKENQELGSWFQGLLGLRPWKCTVYVPAISNYEVRRGLLHIALRNGRSTTRSLERLNLLISELDYLPLTQNSLDRAAHLWAQSRHEGQATSGPEGLDGDAILAAQALEISGLVVTENVRHLSRYVSSHRWSEIDP